MVRRNKPKNKITKHNIRRRALPALLADFESRCAYSMQHVDMLGGVEHLEIDHFDPRVKELHIQVYENLFPAKRACNNNKRSNWPTDAESARGIRFLNPCEENEYHGHIFEDPKTHRLWGATPAGRYHIRTLGLNSKNLIQQRADRSEIKGLFATSAVIPKRAPDSTLKSYIALLRKQLTLGIPEIPLAPEPQTSVRTKPRQ